MLALLTTAALCASCLDDPQRPVAPRLGVPQPTVDQQISDGCARFQVRFDAGGQPVVEPVYNTAACQTNELKLLSDTAAVFDAATGALRVAVVMENTGTAVVIPRVKLRFHADSVVRRDGNGVLVPGASDIVGYQPDSSGGAGRVTFWWYDPVLAASGQQQVLLPGARTQRKWIEFRGTGWTAQVRLKLFATGAEAGSVPAAAPDSLPSALIAPSKLYVPPPGGGFPYYRDLLLLFFQTGTSVAERTRVISLVQGVVVGGFPWRSAEGGAYLIHLPADSSQATLQAARALLRAQPSLRRVGTYSQVPLAPTYLRPNDGPGWTTREWRLERALLLAPSPRIDSWGPAFVGAPLAWGCSTGDSTLHVGILDHGFHTSGVPDLTRTYRRRVGVNLSNDTLRHGTWVTSVLAATGGNSQGMAGVAWSSSLSLWDPSKLSATGNQLLLDSLGRRQDDTYDAIRAIKSIADSGVKVVNISLGADTGRAVVDLSDSSKVEEARFLMGQLKDELTFLGKVPPLLVVSAGNRKPGGDPRESLFPYLRDSMPAYTLVVAAMNRDTSLFFATSGSPYIDMAAPGRDVFALDERGGVYVSGASFATPIAAGVAALLGGFDARLSTDSIRLLVLEGARRGGRTAGGYPVPDAFESLKLAAERTGAPLCGNRVFERGDTVFAQRNPALSTSASDERLGVFPSAYPALTVEHGGRSITTHLWGGAGAQALVYGPSGWTVQARNPLLPNSGFARSTEGASHDGDSTVNVAGFGAQASVTLQNTQTQQLSPPWVPGAAVAGLGYDPSRPRLVAFVGGQTTWALQLVDFSTTAATATPLNVTYPGRQPWHVGIAEDGSEARVLTMDAGAFVGQCYIDWVSLRPGELGAIKRTVTVPKNAYPGNGNCSGDGAIGRVWTPAPSGGNR